MKTQSTASMPVTEILEIFKKEDAKMTQHEPKIESEFKIDSTIPLAEAKQRTLLFPFDKLTCSDSHQDSFFVPESHPNYKKLSPSISYYGQKMNKTFRVRTVTELGVRGQRCRRIK